MKIMTGYSFNHSAGHLQEVMDRIVECEYPAAPIADFCSTFGFVRWRKMAKKAGLRPVYGVTINVTDGLQDKKPATSEVTFYAKSDVARIHELIATATNQFRYTPLLTYDQLNEAQDVIKIIGHRAKLDRIHFCEDTFVALSPATYKGFLNKARDCGAQLIYASENRYTNSGDRVLYETLLGRNANTQSYPQHILSVPEWREAVVKSGATEAELELAICNASLAMERCDASLPQGTLLTPRKDKTLRQLCVEGAAHTGCDLTDPIYAARLERELALIDDKGFEDYFYIVSEMITWAKQRMVVGPGRGSSSGSLVCFLLGITMIDPIPYALLFERFIDINRLDLPDIDIDFSAERRDLVFQHAEALYGADHIARLGTVQMFKSRSVVKDAATSLGVPFWKSNPVLDSLIETSSGDARALKAVEDTFTQTPAGQLLIREHPEMKIATRMEGHPSNKSQHAAGIIITAEPVVNYVAVDSKTGGTYCDKKDAEELNLLKIDALGLTQLSVFEDCLEAIGKPREWLEKIPLDDQGAFDILNARRYSGIFQFEGAALQRVASETDIKELNDIISLTALARPGPLSSGSTAHWIKRKKGIEETSIPHPLFEPYLGETFGVVVYQEQIMSIVREVGGLSWEDTSNLRKAMSRSLGREFFDQYGDPFKAECERRGIPAQVAFDMWDGLCAFGAWCLSGSTRLRNPYPNASEATRFFTIKELYERQGLLNNPATPKRQKLFMWDGEGLKPTPNVLVTYSGVKETVLVTTDKGRSIRATKDHKFLRADGEYTRLDDMAIGDEIMGMGGSQPTVRHTPKGVGRGRHNWRQTELDGKPFLTGKRGTRTQVRNEVTICEECLEAPMQEVHHVNMDHTDHRRENLKGVCRKCHKRLHREQEGLNPIGFTRGYGIEPETIVSIGEPMMEDVYDISMPAPHHNFLAEDLVVHNCFNKSHAVAYGLISYQCAYLKAHYPMEFCAATLSHKKEVSDQLVMLRELRREGVDYVPVDAEKSTNKWRATTIDGRKLIVGPVQNVVGIGPKIVQEILSARTLNLPLPGRAAKLLANPITKVDTLSPIEEAFRKVMPDPAERNIHTMPTPLENVVVTGFDYEVLVFVTMAKINPKDENEDINVAKRGGRKLSGPHLSLGLHLADDTGNVYAKVSRWDYEVLAKPIINRGRSNKALYCIKGTVPKDFRMINISMVRYIGDVDPKHDEYLKQIEATKQSASGQAEGGTSNPAPAGSYGAHLRSLQSSDGSPQADQT